MKLLPYFLLCSILTFGQEALMKKQKVDSIIYYHNNRHGIFKDKFLRRAYDLSKEIKNDTLLRESCTELGYSFYSKRDTVGLKEVNSTLLGLFFKNKDSISLAKHYHFKALIFRIQKRLDSSFYYYNESKKMSLKIRDSVEAGGRCVNMSYMQKNGRDYVGAEASIIEGIGYLEPLKEFKYTPDSYNSLGNILSKIRHYQEAIIYYEKSLKSNEANPSKESREKWKLIIYNNIGYTYLIQDKAKEALPYFQKALEYDSISIKYPGRYQLLLGNYSDANYLMGNKKDAWKDFWKLLRFREKNNNIFGQGVSHNGFAYYYMLEGDNKRALYHARKSYELTKKVNNNFTLTSVLIKLAKLTSDKEAKKYFEEYVSLNDSLRNIELNLKSNFTKIRYETEKKEKENVTLKLDNDRKAIEVEKVKQQRIIGWLAAVVLLLTLGLSITFYRNRRKKLLYESQLEKTIAVQEERTRERNRISQELHDGVLSRLFGIRVNMGFLDFNAEGKVKKQYQSLLSELQDVETEIRDTSHKLHGNFHNSDSNFLKGIQKLLETKSIVGKLQHEFKSDTNISWNEIEKDVKEDVYHIIQEALQNIIKHANAQKVILKMSSESNRYVIQIEDDGVGFDVKTRKKGIGLKNMRARVQKISGNIEITSTQGKGTKIVITT